MPDPINVQGAQVFKSELSEQMLEDTVKEIIQVCDSENDDKEIATKMKSIMDSKYGVTWQCVVGKTYASYVTYEKGAFLDVVYNGNALLLFKAGIDSDTEHD